MRGQRGRGRERSAGSTHAAPPPCLPARRRRPAGLPAHWLPRALPSLTQCAVPAPKPPQATQTRPPAEARGRSRGADKAWSPPGRSTAGSLKRTCSAAPEQAPLPCPAGRRDGGPDGPTDPSLPPGPPSTHHVHGSVPREIVHPRVAQQREAARGGGWRAPRRHPPPGAPHPVRHLGQRKQWESRSAVRRWRQMQPEQRPGCRSRRQHAFSNSAPADGTAGCQVLTTGYTNATSARL